MILSLAFQNHPYQLNAYCLEQQTTQPHLLNSPNLPLRILGATRNDVCLNIASNWHFAHMHFKNFFTATDIRQWGPLPADRNDLDATRQDQEYQDDLLQQRR